MDRSLIGIEFKINFPFLIKNNLKSLVKTKTFRF